MIYCTIARDERYKALQEKLRNATVENRQALLTEIAVLEQTIRTEEKLKTDAAHAKFKRDAQIRRPDIYGEAK